MTEPIDETLAGVEFGLEVLQDELAAFDEPIAAAWLRVLAGTLLDVWHYGETLPEDPEAKALILTDVALLAIDRADQEIEPPLHPGVLPTGIEAAIVKGAHELAAMNGSAGPQGGRLLSFARGERGRACDDEVERAFWMWPGWSRQSRPATIRRLPPRVRRDLRPALRRGARRGRRGAQRRRLRRR